MKKLILERDALKANIDLIRERAGSALIYAVLIGDGYGAGAVELARLLREEGIVRFAISEVSEAAALRRAGFVEEELLMLRSTTNREELEQLLDLNVVCTVGSLEAAMTLNGVAGSRATVAEAHLLIDTGLGFGGFVPDENDKILSVFQNLSSIAVSGVCTQVHSERKDGQDIAAALEIFRGAVDGIRAAGLEPGVVHAAGSFPLLHCEDVQMDAVRVGSALLGRCLRTKNDGLQQVGYGEVTIAEVRWLPAGRHVGAEQPVFLKKPTRVAVLPVGYLNGFGVSRSAGSGIGEAFGRWRAERRAYVRIGGEKAEVLGGIGAIETLVDVTELKCGVGDTAEFDIEPMLARGLAREYR